MKKLLYYLSITIICFCLCGCCFMKKSAKDAVKDFLNQYKMLSTDVLTDLEKVIAEEDFDDDEKEMYRSIMKKQYRDLKYSIVDEECDGDTAVVKAKISVYDLYKAQKDATIYLNSHLDEFKNSKGEFNEKKYTHYKLENMKKANETIEYTINFNVKKGEKGKWKVQQLSNNDLKKIHGIYNYENE